MRVRAGLVLLLVPSLLHAQRDPLRQEAAVPVDLAAALATAGGLPTGNEPQILVGEIPAWFATRLRLPDGAVVLGTAVSGAAAIAVVQTLETGDAPMNNIEPELAALGWHRPPSEPSGFKYVTTASVPMVFPMQFCSAGKSLRVSRGPARQGRQTWFYRINDIEGPYGGCAANPRGRETSLPVLFHPVDAARESFVRTRDCATTDRDLGGASGTGDRIRTSMSVDSLLKHYDKQLAAAGWQPFRSQITEINRMWSRTDSTGKAEIIGIDLRTSSDNPQCRDLSLMRYGRDR